MNQHVSPLKEASPTASPLADLGTTATPAPVGADDPAFAESFGGFLVQDGAIDHLVLERAHRATQATGERFDQVLTKLGLLSDNDLALAYCKYLSIPIAQPAELPPEPILVDTLGADFVRRNRIMPLAATQSSVVVAVVDPFNDEPVRALAFLIGRQVSLRLMAPADFDKAFDALYLLANADVNRVETAEAADASELDIQRLRDIASEAPVIRLVNQLIADAVETGASDIHIEPNGEALIVRHRIDGLLRTAELLKLGLRAALTSRIKIMAKLDIAERRLPQDGRIKIAVRGVDIDFRISTIPTVFGESVVMRILDRSRVELDFAALGFAGKQIAMFEDFIGRANGIVLVTGPTGSGKTTTLYTMLKRLNRVERKVFTVEDPIEYQLTGVNQVQVQPGIGLTFPHALRSILRQDPDIIMIGEIRDLETARIAIQAALTGHLVLSTLHTNSAAATITRLIDMGLESYLLASTIKGIIAQRLVRRLCPACAIPDERAVAWTSEITCSVRGLDAHGAHQLRHPRGCPSCNGSGFSGRTTIAEVMPITAAMHRRIAANASDADLEAAAREDGMATLYESGAIKAWCGETTMDEVLRATRVA
ncbi:MAG TPA: ATPase, T2SS/T4P/T4SS family [Pseudolabrys sp.]|nr:ATPase, T2SS/T4P/T4SS family [Pseudolabrys sp.]